MQGKWKEAVGLCPHWAPSTWDWGAAGNQKCPKLRYVWRYSATYFLQIPRASVYLCEPIRASTPVTGTGQSHVLGHHNSVVQSAKLLVWSLIWTQPMPPSCPQKCPKFGSECESGNIPRREQESRFPGVEKRAETFLHLPFSARYPQAQRVALSTVTAWEIQENMFRSGFGTQCWGFFVWFVGCFFTGDSFES